MENSRTIKETAYRLECERCANEHVNTRKREKLNHYVAFSAITLATICICITVYGIITLQELKIICAKSIQNNKITEDELSKIKIKYEQLEQEFKAFKSAQIKPENSIVEINDIEPKTELTHKGWALTHSRTKRSTRHDHDSQVPLLRQKRAKRRKKCKNCLPAIQIEGSSASITNNDKSELSGIWTPASWHMQYSRVRSAFHYSHVGHDGSVSVKRTGLYLLYAQVTLIGETKRGYKILRRKADGNIATLAVCKRHINGDGNSDSDSCCTVKVVKLEERDSVFIQEESDNTGANYSKSHSYFGLVLLGTL